MDFQKNSFPGEGFGACVMLVQAATTLNVPANWAWEALKRRDTFLFITRGIMRYRGADSWPEILMASGVEIETAVYPIGIFPGISDRIAIVSVDEEAMEVRTNESGGLIRIWNHTMKVEPLTESRCRYSDRIELDAGWLTPIIWSFASLFYRYRQFRWHRLTKMAR